MICVKTNVQIYLKFINLYFVSFSFLIIKTIPTKEIKLIIRTIKKPLIITMPTTKDKQTVILISHENVTSVDFVSFPWECGYKSKQRRFVDRRAKIKGKIPLNPTRFAIITFNYYSFLKLSYTYQTVLKNNNYWLIWPLMSILPLLKFKFS